MTKKTPDLINHPKHYNAHPSGVECIQVTEHMTFNIGNAVKYLWRCEEKGAHEADLRKAKWYIERELQRLGFDVLLGGKGKHAGVDNE